MDLVLLIIYDNGTGTALLGQEYRLEACWQSTLAK